MKHLKPVTKAQTTTTGTAAIVAMVLSLLTALAPIITAIIDQKDQTV